jgi:hypothetical protein
VVTVPAIALLAIGVSAPAQAAAITTGSTVAINGPAVILKITAPGKSAKATFTGKVGQRISAVITNPVTSDNGCETLTLLDPGGAPVTSGSGCTNGNPVGLGPVDLTISGTYTVQLQLDTTATGSAKLWVSAPVSAGTATVNGPATAMNVTRVGQGVQRTFKGKVGQRISVAITNPVSSDNGCETLTLLGPGGATVDSSSACTNGNPAGVGPTDLTVAGTYTVRLEFDTTATATSKLWVSAPVTVGTVTVNGPAVAMDVTRAGQGVQRTFSGHAGQRISAVIANPVTSDNGCETLTLLGPGGATVSSSTACTNGNPVGVGPVALPSTGTYTVRFEVDTTATGFGKLKVTT